VVAVTAQPFRAADYLDSGQYNHDRAAERAATVAAELQQRRQRAGFSRQYNTKTLGGRTDAGWSGKALPAARYHAPPLPAAQYGDPVGPSGVERVDGASFDAAMAAGRRALEAGYGGVLPDAQAPCGTCPSCTYGHPEGCRRPASKAMARLRAHQAVADVVDQAERASVEMARIVWREERRREQVF
jgi:hypothetical protein